MALALSIISNHKNTYMKLLEGKVAIVTGASRGIGEAIAVKISRAWCQHCLYYVSSDEKAKALEEKLQAFGVKAKAYKSNAGIFEECETMVNDVVKEFGTIDVCVNNAGISKDNLLLRMTPEQWDDVMTINLKSVFNMTKQVIRPMMKARKGSIINMSSIIGMRAMQAKAVMQHLKPVLLVLQNQWRTKLGSRNIRCNAIAPGFVETDMTHYLKEGEASTAFLQKIPLGRFATAEEIADTTLYLASDMSSYVTGQVISVCGGLNI